MINQIFRLRIAALVAAMAAMMAVCLPASSAQAQGPRAPRSSQAATSASASAQCTVPVGQRTGAWFCSDGTGPSTAALGPLPAASSIHCHTGWGCWYVDTPSQAEFFSDHLTYGYGTRVIGTSDYHVIWKLGTVTVNTSAQSAMTLSAPSEFIVFSGSLMNGAHNVVGDIIHQCTDVD